MDRLEETLARLGVEPWPRVSHRDTDEGALLALRHDRELACVRRRPRIAWAASTIRFIRTRCNWTRSPVIAGRSSDDVGPMQLRAREREHLRDRLVDVDGLAGGRRFARQRLQSHDDFGGAARLTLFFGALVVTCSRSDEHILRVLEAANWVIGGANEVAARRHEPDDANTPG